MALPKHIDARNKVRIARLRPSWRGRALQFLHQCAMAGLDVVVIEVERDDANQLEHFAKGREKRGGRWVKVGKTVTNARTAAQTPHGRRGPARDAGASAWDYAEFRPDGTWSWDDASFFARCGAIAESLGFVWGGRFGESKPGAGDGWDAGHIEVPGWDSFPLLKEDAT